MKYPDDFINKVICGDCIEIMKDIPDRSIDLTVTSPPYDTLRDYKGYVFNFGEIAEDLFRITKQNGIVVWIVKDSVKNGNRSLNSFKQALFFQKTGFNIYDIMIYAKTGSSLPHKNRYSDIFEYMFVLSRGFPKTVNLLKDRRNRYARTSTWGIRRVREKDGSLTDRKKQKIGEYSIRSNIWEYATGWSNTTRDEIAFKHPAIFPDKLAEDHILSWSNEGEIVLDPMCGSGTTCKMAKKLNRCYIGIEISSEYCEIARKRLKTIPERLDKWIGS